MVRLITESISILLNAAFGDGYKIYDESIEQGLKEPCFFIQCLKPTNNLFRGKRYYRTNEFCIQYFPVSNNKVTECEQVAEQLFEVLEWLTFYDDGTKLLGKDLHYEISDGVLSFFVNYDLFMRKNEELDAMETVDVSFAEKKGAKNNGN